MLPRLIRRVRALGVRATARWRPHVTVVVVRAGQDAPLVRRRDTGDARLEYVTGSAVQAVAAARAPFVVFVDREDQVPVEVIARLAAEPYRGVAIVPLARDGLHRKGSDRWGLAAVVAPSLFPRADALRAVRRLAGLGGVSASDARAMTAAHLRFAPRTVDAPDLPEACAPASAAAVEHLGAAAHAHGVREAVERGIGRAEGVALRERPHARADAVARLTERGLGAAALSELNAATATTLLVAYGFPPFVDASGFIAARRMALRGEPYDVLTKDLTGERGLDARSVDLAHELLGRRMVVPGRVGFGSWRAITVFCARGTELVAERERVDGPYTTVYSRSMWPAATVFGALYKARNPSTTWIAELSDPLTVRTDATHREHTMPDNPWMHEIAAAIGHGERASWDGAEVFPAIEWMAFSLADEVVFTNENQRELMLSMCPDQRAAERARGVSRVSHHPPPPDDFYGRATAAHLPQHRVCIAYFGRFYGLRSADDLIAPFARLTPDEQSRVALVIFTSDAADAGAALARFPHVTCVEVRPALSYFEFLATTRAVDWLIVADTHSPPEFSTNPYLPSKLADYRGSGTRIWALAEPGSVLSSEQLDAASELGDVDSAVRVLRHIMAQPSHMTQG